MIHTNTHTRSVTTESVPAEAVFSLQYQLKAEDAQAFSARLVNPNLKWLSITSCLLTLGSVRAELFTSRAIVAVGFSLIVAILFLLCCLPDQVITRWIYWFYRRTLVISIGEENVIVKWINSKQAVTSTQRIPWTSLSTYGTATEYSEHFMLHSGRGTVWIAKRAFSSDAEMAAFRSFVADKMGTRSKIGTNSEAVASDHILTKI